MSFLIKYDELPEEYNEIWNIQSYRKSYERKIKTLCIYLRVIMIDSVWRTGKNYYPQMFLEEF